MESIESTNTQNIATVRTSEQGWLAKLAGAYRDRSQILVIDDSNVGIDPSSQSILNMGLHSRLSRRDWWAVLLSVGLTTFGAAMVILAVVDPDPTSKLGLLIGSGATLIFCGGFSAIRILTNRKPPKVIVSPRGSRSDGTRGLDN